MKFSNIILLSGAIVAATASYAQKGKVLTAYNYQQAFYASSDCNELAKAQEAIELGLTDEKASVWAKTWYYRGNIYYDIYVSEDDACRGIEKNALNIAYDSYMKAIEYDEKERYLKDIEPKLAVIASFFVQKGANNYNTKNYEGALADFEKSIEVSRYFKKTDTTALYNAALCAEKVQNYSKATLYYEGLVDIGYDDPRLYHFLSEAYLAQGDTAKSIQAITTGRKAYPSNEDLIIDELNHYLQRDQQQLALENLEVAIKEMPDNPELYFAKGTILDKIGQVDQAQVAYEEALKIDPTNFNANYNLGALYYNLGVEQVDAANDLTEKQVAEFKELEAKAKSYFQQSIPYLEKAHELDPQDRATMESLKNLYSRTGNEEGYKRMAGYLNN